MKNDSGFHGFNAASLYPDMGDRVTDTMTTIIDPEEQASMSGIDPDKVIRPATNPDHKRGVWIALAVMVAFIFLFARSG